MTRDDVTKMAKQAGIEMDDRFMFTHDLGVHVDNMERFCQLVAVHERERCIDAVWQQKRHGGGKDYAVGLQMAVNAIRARGAA